MLSLSDTGYVFVTRLPVLEDTPWWEPEPTHVCCFYRNTTLCNSGIRLMYKVRLHSLKVEINY